MLTVVQNNIKIITKLIISGLAIALSANFSHARIGATSEECAAHYGVARESRPDGSKITYRREGILTNCWFIEGRCVAVNYEILTPSMVDRPDLGSGPRFSMDQSMSLLNLNRGTSTWSQESKQAYGEAYDGIYATADGKFRASVSFVGVTVESVEAVRLWSSATTEQAVSKTIASFSSPTASAPEIRHDAPLPPEELEAQRRAADMEQNLQNIQRSQEDVAKSFAEMNEALANVAARAAKREEMKRHHNALKEIQDAVARATTDAEKTAAEEKEAEWLATANRLIAEYEALKPTNTTND